MTSHYRALPAGAQDLLIRGGVIHTGAEAMPTAEIVIARAGRIAYVGPAAGAPSTGAASASRRTAFRGSAIRASAIPSGAPIAVASSAVPVPRRAVLKSSWRCRASSNNAENAFTRLSDTVSR